jgi:hypothetical protein
MMSWESITAIATLVLTIGALIAFYMRQGSLMATVQSDLTAQERRTNEITVTLKDQGLLIAAHATSITAHEGSFKVIDVKLDNIKEAVDKLGCK